ncbi:MAG: LPS export ABC transporter periplasmic protein LptC [Desulfobulbus sp.]|jgi:LPS export ABC transporter protein LptC|uniref:LPS export ABC transporter periplasmic protein LptC n=1 Tax=Desulfobulbus sp. TaxID=895 RepID=UPI00284B6E36|nr:LPS export ABC transporter periplasmic protein LptC [Desulfobulbus sp.]MDR2551252.1 LPS export ABC transporter periplasmic protein LptC [Desulfobulbus sp.]
MIKNPRNLLWLLPVLLFVTSPLWRPPLAAFLAPRGGYNPKLAQPQEESPIQNFVLESVAITMTSNGKEEWQIDANRAYTQGDDHEIEMEEVSAMYIGSEREPINIESRKGLYFIDKRHLVLTDHVKVVKPLRNQVMLSERLEYDDADKVLVSPGKVTILAPGMKLNAGRMDYDFSTEGFEFSDRVKVNL